MIVVCPNTFKSGWLDEIEKHGFRFDVHIWQSAKKADALAFLSLGYHPKGPAVLIINYDAARMSGVLRALCIWAARGKAYLAIDESIQIKGPKSLQTKAMQILAPTCLYTRLLTGRPQTQGPHDLWGQLRAIGVLPGVNFYAFRGRYCFNGGLARQGSPGGEERRRARPDHVPGGVPGEEEGLAARIAAQGLHHPRL